MVFPDNPIPENNLHSKAIQLEDAQIHKSFRRRAYLISTAPRQLKPFMDGCSILNWQDDSAIRTKMPFKFVEKHTNPKDHRRHKWSVFEHHNLNLIIWKLPSKRLKCRTLTVFSQFFFCENCLTISGGDMRAIRKFNMNVEESMMFPAPWAGSF